MKPLSQPKHASVSSKPIVDLTISSPATPITTSNILTGAFHALNNSAKNNDNTTNTNNNPLIPAPLHQNKYRNAAGLPAPQPLNKTPSIPVVHGSLLRAPNPPNFQKPNAASNSNHITPKSTTNKSPPEPPSFTSGNVDLVSFNYDANRLKHSDFHDEFECLFAAHVDEMVANETATNEASKMKTPPLNPHAILNAARLKFENHMMRRQQHQQQEGVPNYADYNLFREDDQKQSVIAKLFDPSYDHGIRDAHLFNYISRNILQLHCVGDIGIDILNFLHSLFIILYWNDRSFALQLNEIPMHGVLRLLQELVPLQTCVWWLNLHHSLNKINAQSTLPSIDLKNILNKQTEKNIFYINLIKRLMSSGEQQANTWKDYLLQSHNDLNSFLFDEKQRRLSQITPIDEHPFNKQLKNYIQQLLLPKLIIRCRQMTDALSNSLIESHRVSAQCLKSRQYLAKNVASYFSDHSDDSGDDDSDDDVILIEEEEETVTPPSPFIMNDDERVSFNKYEQLQKQAKKDRLHSTKKTKKKKHRKRKKKRKKKKEESVMTSTEPMAGIDDEESSADDDAVNDPDFDPLEPLKVERRGRKKKKKGEAEGAPPRKKRRQIHEVLMEGERILSCEEEEGMDDGVEVELAADATVCIDFDRKAIDRFLKCGICHASLNQCITINECMHSFCQTCVNQYFQRCDKEKNDPHKKIKISKCPKCQHSLGQGSITSIRQRICKKDKMKTSLMNLIRNCMQQQLQTTNVRSTSI
eukprot:432281_1